MTWWTAGWLGWTAWFALEEGLALWRGGSAATLSGHVWRWFAITPGPGPLRTLRRFTLLAGLAWLAAHFLTGGRFP